MKPEDIAALAAAQGDIEPLYQDSDDPTVRSDQWSIQNVPTLEWALMRDANLRAEAEQIEAAAQEAKARIEARKNHLLDRVRRGIAFFESQIAKYANEHRATLLGGSNKKSRTLLYGTLGWRKRAGRLVVVDDVALREWLRAQDNVELFRVKIEPEMKALQDLYAKNGTIPPGMEYVVEQEKFYVEPVDPASPLAKVKP